MPNKKRTRRTFSSKEKTALLKEHFLKGRVISELCEEHKIEPRLFYKWREEFFVLSEEVFDSKPSKSSKVKKLEKQIKERDSKLLKKNEVVSELMEEHLALKKKLGLV
jgi:transposase